MATHASAEKRERQSEKAQTRNRWWKSRIRTAARKVTEAVEKKKKTEAKAALVVASREIDKAASQGVIHSRTASRKISRLSKAVTGL